MSITIDIAPELEKRLHVEAAKEGIDTSTYITHTLEEHLRRAGIRLSKREGELLQKINLGLSQEEWQCYHDLVAKRRTETITPKELQQLISLSDQIELANARRIESLIELAQLRKMSLKTLMQTLGIESPGYV
jgi:hypothetical protein